MGSKIMKVDTVIIIEEGLICNEVPVWEGTSRTVLIIMGRNICRKERRTLMAPIAIREIVFLTTKPALLVQEFSTQC